MAVFPFGFRQKWNGNTAQEGANLLQTPTYRCLENVI